MACSRLAALAAFFVVFQPNLTQAELAPGPTDVESPFQTIPLRHKREEGISTCGVRNTKDKQNDSESTSYGEFTWMIDVRKKEGESSRVRCGGSLIRPNVVLTGAHCVWNVKGEDLVVRAGQWDRSEGTKEGFQEREVIRLVSHQEYNSPPLANDVALLFLKKPFDITESVNVVCLPSEKIEMDTTKCLATGWGRNHLTKDLQQSKLRKVDLPIVERKECEEKLRNFTEKRKNFEFHDSFICAGGQALKDTCSGDGGGPLVCSIKGEANRYAQIGIVSWGVGCGNEIPAVYTSVQYYSAWISDELSS